MVSSVWLSLLVINCVVPAWPALAHTNQEKFMQWLSAGGLDVGNLMLQISTFDGERGLQAKRDIKQGDVMLRIPNSMVLTYETVLASDIKDVMVPLQKELPEKVLFALFILHEKGKGEAADETDIFDPAFYHEAFGESPSMSDPKAPPGGTTKPTPTTLPTPVIL